MKLPPLASMPSSMDTFAASIRTCAPHRRLGVPSAATTHRPIRSLTCVDTSQDAWVPCPRCEGQSRVHGMSPCPIWFASRAVQVRLLTLRALISRIEIHTGCPTCVDLLYKLSRPCNGGILRMYAPLSGDLSLAMRPVCISEQCLPGIVDRCHGDAVLTLSCSHNAQQDPASYHRSPALPS